MNDILSNITSDFKRFNILYISHTSLIGGGEKSLLALIGKLDRRRFCPIVVCPCRGPLVDELKTMRVTVEIVNIKRIRRLNIFATLRVILKLIMLIKKHNIDLVHTNATRVNILGGVAARLAAVPVIWHARNLIYKGMYDVERLFVIIANKVIANSNAVKDRFGKECKKVVTIYNGVDLEEFNLELSGDKIKEEFGLGADIPIVGIIGRLGLGKGHEYFLDSAAKVSKVMPQVKFMVVGGTVFKEDKWRQEILKHLTEELNLSKNVIFTGFRRDIPEIMEALDILVLATEAEPFGRVLIEAMACGKPVVATNAGGVSEIVEDGVTGILVSPKNSEKITQAVLELLGDLEKAKKMGLAGRKKVERFFDNRENVKKTEELYLTLLRGSNNVYVKK